MQKNSLVTLLSVNRIKIDAKLYEQKQLLTTLHALQIEQKNIVSYWDNEILMLSNEPNYSSNNHLLLLRQKTAVNKVKQKAEQLQTVLKQLQKEMVTLQQEREKLEWLQNKQASILRKKAEKQEQALLDTLAAKKRFWQE